MKLTVPSGVPLELQGPFADLISQINAAWLIEHDEDGHHSAPFQNTLVGASFLTCVQPRARLLAQSTSANPGASVKWSKPSIATGIIDAGYDTGSPTFLPAAGDTILRLIEPGTYLILANVRWDVSAVGERFAELTHTNATSSIARDGWKPGSASGVSHLLAAIVPVPYRTGETQGVGITVDVSQTSGGALNIVSGQIEIIKLS